LKGIAMSINKDSWDHLKSVVMADMGNLAPYVTDPRAGKNEQEQLRTNYGEVRFAGPEPIDPVQHYRNALKKTQQPAKRQFGLVEKAPEYTYGRNLNVTMMENPGVTEDGMVVVESELGKTYRYKHYDPKAIEESLGIKSINLYSDGVDYKPFPGNDSEEAKLLRHEGVLSSIPQGSQGRPMPDRSIGEREGLGMGLVDDFDPLAPLPEELVKKLTGKGE
jgi:hypothetical protein